MRRVLFVMLLFLGILFFSGCTTQQNYSSEGTDNKRTQGSIFFRTFNGPSTSDMSETYISYVVSMPERSIQRMGYENSDPGQAISSDGKFVALICKNDNTSICIFNSSSIFDKTSISPESNKVQYGDIQSTVITKLSIPQECFSIDKPNSAHQMSWSYDDKRISIICGTKITKTILCIINIDGNSACYPKTSDERIIFASWSPKIDLLAVSSTTYNSESPITYLFNPNTGSFQRLFSGFAPAWSPRGDKIASFYEYKNATGNFRYGLQVYSINDKKLISLLPNSQSIQAEFEVWPTVDEREEECSISWSVDESQLIFSSRVIHFQFSTLVLYDFNSGNIQFLLDPFLFQSAQSIPQWSPYVLGGSNTK